MLSCRSCRIQADYHQREATDNNNAAHHYNNHNFEDVENDDDGFHGDE